MKLKLSLTAAALASVWLACAPTACGQGAFTIVHRFAVGSGGNDPFPYYPNSDGYRPQGTLVLGNDGNFYGTTVLGGVHGDVGSSGANFGGTIFRVTPAGTLTTLHAFAGKSGSQDGDLVDDGLVQGSDGNLYGMCSEDGGPPTSPGSGTLFKITPDGTFTLLYVFGLVAKDPLIPRGGLTEGSPGTFYGCSQAGGDFPNNSEGYGVIYQVTSNGVLTKLHSFSAGAADGDAPLGGLLKGSDGNLYGTTSGGGASGRGTIFKMTPAGAFTTLYSFGPSNGSDPEARLIQDVPAVNRPMGNLYGTTVGGGANGNGTIFELTPNGVFTTLHSFGATDLNGFNADGAKPRGSVTLNADGSLSGTTSAGGPSGTGTVFRLPPGGTLTTVQSFGFQNQKCVNQGGAVPYSALVADGQGNLYGTTTQGGLGGSGTVYRISAAGALSTVYTFTAAHDSYVNTDGAEVESSLIQASDGNLYGVSQRGGAAGVGTVFKLARDGTLTTLYSFSAVDDHRTNGDGAFPIAALIQGSDGSFYGTTTDGGAGANGTVFRLTPSGVLTTLHSFVGTDGGNPNASVLQASDGNLYGTAFSGGATNDGTVFRLTPGGVLTVLYSFSGSDGDKPYAALVQGRDGYLYGTTSALGPGGGGTVFRITTAGTLTTLHAFDAVSSGFPAVNTGGKSPSGTLLQASDGNFYGTAYEGGANGSGTVFRVTSDGGFATVHDFNGFVAVDNNDGYGPNAALIQGNDGNLYGTTSGGGNPGGGTVFQMSLSGTLTALHDFNVLEEGTYLYGGVIQGTDGNLYGAAEEGGEGYGAIYALTTDQLAFFTGAAALGDNAYYLAFPGNGNVFGYYEFLANPHFIYHFDLGFEYVLDAGDGHAGVYLYDFKSNTFWYTSPTFAFPYLYDFSLQAFLYYYPDPTNPQRYNTNGVRYFYNFATGRIISK